MTNKMVSIYRSVDDWLEETKPLHVKIQTILDLEPGENLKCLCIDRDFYEFIDQDHPEEFEIGETTTASTYFSNNNYIRYIRFTKGAEKNNIKGNFFIGSIEEINTEVDNTEVDNTEFDIEYLSNRWHFLQNGELYTDDFDFNVMTNRRWDDFPLETRLGLRGPMIPIGELDTVPIRMNALLSSASVPRRTNQRSI